MKRLCLEPRCPEVATYRGRCRGHQRKRNRDTSPNRHIYDRRKWRRTSRRYKFDHPICEREGCEALAEDVHHKQAIQDGGNPWDMDNLEALCRSHHSSETRREQGAIHGST